MSDTKKTEVRFYHLERQSLSEALPALLSKALHVGHRVVIKCADQAMMDQLNNHLWTYAPDSFLPHGSEKDDHKDEQPIYLTTGDDNPNNASVLILTHGTESESLTTYALCCEIFEGGDHQSLQTARKHWSAYKANDNLELTYWQQGPSGWVQKDI